MDVPTGDFVVSFCHVRTSPARFLMGFACALTLVVVLAYKVRGRESFSCKTVNGIISNKFSNTGVI